MASVPFNVGEQVWVRTGLSGNHEELATVLSISPATRRSGQRSGSSGSAFASGSAKSARRADADDDGRGGVTVKFSVSGYRSLVEEADRIRPMTAADDERRDASGRRLRRSGRAVVSPVPIAAGAAADNGRRGAEKSPPSHAASVTPTPAELDGGGPGDGEDGATEAAAAGPEAEAGRGKRKRATSAARASSKKRAGARRPSPGAEAEVTGGCDGPKGSPYFAMGTEEFSRVNSSKRTDGNGSTEPAGKKPSSAGGGRKLIMAFSDDEGGDDCARGQFASASGPASSKRRKPAKATKASASKSAAKGTATAPKERKPPGAKKLTAMKKIAAAAKEKKPPGARKAGSASPKTPHKYKGKRAFTWREREGRGGDGDAAPPVEGGRPDGNGGLNQPIPWVVEYSKTGRATCRTCDERIAKGQLRVGHTPLFRGKPGFMVYRHLHCTVFSEDIACAEDVENHETLAEEDYLTLAEQVDASAEKRREEQEELHPDELVQKGFEGEVRPAPPGLTATLLPFQVEGFSWMRHQEVVAKEVRGGILADEMGMGKTVQTIATILDNRPKLQHTKPGMKHPPTADMKERQDEESLWDKAKSDWSNEMEVLKVPKKLRLRDGGARAGTLVVCPVIALSQWKTEIEKFTERGLLSVCTYHGPDREKETPRELMKKYDVVLTTYQVLEADFRKMTSPNRVECPNCGGKFKIDKLPIHLKYFCGERAERTEAQARQRRNSDRQSRNGRRGRGPRRSEGGSKQNKGKKGEKKQMTTTKKKFPEEKKKASAPRKSSGDEKKLIAGKKKPAEEKRKISNSNVLSKKQSGKTKQKKGHSEKEIPSAARAGSKRNAARKAASQISRSASEWGLPAGESDSDSSRLEVESSSSDGSDSGSESSSEGHSSDSSSDSEMERAREKQRQALEMANANKKAMSKTLMATKTTAKKNIQKKSPGKTNGKGKPKKSFDSDEDYSSSDSGCGDADIDMAALMAKAMAGAKNSILHSVSWWRIILDEAHFIKTRSSQTANAAFSLIGVHRWCLSGTPLQNRVGEFYSLVRFLRLDPMAYYYCRAKGCDCKSMHYRIHAGICECCGHSGIQHYSHFNKYILNPVVREGYRGDGRRAMHVLKNEVLDKALLRRTKETKAADMELPPRLVQIKAVPLHPVEEDFYSALYTQTKSSFDDYVSSGTLLNNYAHIFDLLIRMRQSVDHPYLVIYSKKNTSNQMTMTQPGEGHAVANGSVDCDLCHEPPTDRVVSSCCGAAYCRSCVLEYMAGQQSMSGSDNLVCPSCREAFSIDLQATADIEDDSALKVLPGRPNGGSDAGMPSLKELQHVATGSILRRIDLSMFATSSKIEALTRELVIMAQTSPGSKAIVFSQFVNMLDLIRWRLHSDPYLEDIGLGCRALHGGMNVKARDTCLKEFREDNNVRVLLMSLKAGGVALNLTCANFIYLMDPWWNPAAEMQAIDRTHRLGQYRPIRAIRFIAENTVEERILQLQEKKRLVFDGTVGRDAGSLKMLTVDDMKSLFA